MRPFHRDAAARIGHADAHGRCGQSPHRRCWLTTLPPMPSAQHPHAPDSQRRGGQPAPPAARRRRRHHPRLPGPAVRPVDDRPGPVRARRRRGVAGQAPHRRPTGGPLPTWSITVVPSDRWCGNIDLRPDGEGGVEVGYLLAPWARGHGHAARALRLVCAWAFSALDAQVVTWYAFAGNDASLHTARRVGFQVPDHVFRAYGAQRGARRDSWVGHPHPRRPRRRGRSTGDARGRYLGPELTRRELDVLRHMHAGPVQPHRSPRSSASARTPSRTTSAASSRSCRPSRGPRRSSSGCARASPRCPAEPATTAR